MTHAFPPADAAPRRRARWPWIAAAAVLLAGLIAAAYLVARDPASTTPTAATASPSPTATTPPAALSPSPTPTGPLTERDTCVQVLPVLSEATDLLLLFNRTEDITTLGVTRFAANARALRAVHDVAAATLKTNIGIVLDAMDKIVKLYRQGGSLKLDNGPIGVAGATVVTKCATLGVRP